MTCYICEDAYGGERKGPKPGPLSLDFMTAHQKHIAISLSHPQLEVGISAFKETKTCCIAYIQTASTEWLPRMKSSCLYGAPICASKVPPLAAPHGAHCRGACAGSITQSCFSDFLERTPKNKTWDHWDKMETHTNEENVLNLVTCAFCCRGRVASSSQAIYQLTRGGLLQGLMKR